MSDTVVIGEQLLQRPGACEVDVLLAVYNNAAYLPALMASLRQQSFTDFRLIVRNDGSSDDSLDIVLRDAAFFGSRLVVIEGEASGSAKANFALLLQLSDARFTLFADADDIWDADKVAVTVDALRAAELEFGQECPLYVFTDARVVDADGALTHESYWSFKGMKPDEHLVLNTLLVCAPMLGCASGCNRALNRLSQPMPLAEITGHDWWLLLVAATRGRYRTISRPTLSYRTHSTNASSPKRSSLLDFLKLSGKRRRVLRGMMLRRNQARVLLAYFEQDLPEKSREILRKFVLTGEQGFLRRRFTLLFGGYLYPDFPRNIAMLVAM